MQDANPESTKGRWTRLIGLDATSKALCDEKQQKQSLLKNLMRKTLGTKHYSPVCGASANHSESRDPVEIRTEDEAT